MRRKPVQDGGMTSVERKTLNRLLSSYIRIYSCQLVLSSFLFSLHINRYLEWIRDTGSSQDTLRKI